MSTIRANSITDSPGTGAPNFPNGLTSAAGASLASPALTGTPTAPTATTGTNSTQIATTAFVDNSLDQYLILRSVTLDTSSTGAFVNRSLGTTVKNTITGASVSSPTFTLPAGIYLFRASASAYQSNAHHIKLRNTTDATDTLIGSASYSRNDSNAHPTLSVIDSYFEITGSKNFQVQHFADIGAKPLYGPGSNGTTMQTLSVIVQKIG